MSLNYEENVQDRAVAKDTRTLGDFVEIYCRAHHRGDARRPAETDGARLGVYGSKPPVICAECEAHLAYGEKRRAFCPMDPKPFCANCEKHCYRSEESVWHRQMMQFAGPRSMLHGHAIDGIKHMVETRRHKREVERATRPAES